MKNLHSCHSNSHFSQSKKTPMITSIIFRTDLFADFSTFNSNANEVLRNSQHDRKPNPDNLDVKTAAQLVHLITHTKLVLGNTLLRTVYNHCGLLDLCRLLSPRRCSMKCIPGDHTGWFLRQRNLECSRHHPIFTHIAQILFYSPRCANSSSGVRF